MTPAERGDVEPENPEKPSVTIAEVAARAGVSIATVSHALNRPARVAEKTRARVLQSVDELGFVPKGRGRAARSVRRIAVCGPFSTHPSYLQRLAGALQAAEGIDVVVLDDASGSAPVIEVLPLQGPVDGVILMGVEPGESLAADLEAAGTPVVLLDRGSAAYPSVTVDDEAGGALVADHLVNQGARRMAFVSPAPPSQQFVTSGELRARGFTARLRDLGITEEPLWVICEDSFAGGISAVHRLAEQGLPEAIFCHHDLLAAGVLRGLAEQGLHAPEDVLVVGYDGSDSAAALDLTTVAQPFGESGAAALELLRHRFTRPREAITHTVLQPVLVARGTSTSHRPKGTRHD